MSFEELPFNVGDAVTIPSIRQGQGTIEHVEIREGRCLVTVKFANPDIYFEYAFGEEGPFDRHFEVVS